MTVCAGNWKEEADIVTKLSMNREKNHEPHAMSTGYFQSNRDSSNWL